MGIRDQFQDKAREIADRAKAAAQQDEASERAAQAVDQVKDKARDSFDENFGK